MQEPTWNIYSETTIIGPPYPIQFSWGKQWHWTKPYKPWKYYIVFNTLCYCCYVVISSRLVVLHAWLHETNAYSYSHLAISRLLIVQARLRLAQSVRMVMAATFDRSPLNYLNRVLWIHESWWGWKLIGALPNMTHDRSSILAPANGTLEYLSSEHQADRKRIRVKQ